MQAQMHKCTTGKCKVLQVYTSLTKLKLPDVVRSYSQHVRHRLEDAHDDRESLNLD